MQFREHLDAFIGAYHEHAKPFAWTKAKMHQRRVKNLSANCDFQVRVNMLRDIWRGFNRHAIGLPLTLGPTSVMSCGRSQEARLQRLCN